MTTPDDPWPELVLPPLVTTPIRQFLPETIAECEALRARRLNATRESERIEEVYTEGRIARPTGANLHE